MEDAEDGTQDPLISGEDWPAAIAFTFGAAIQDHTASTNTRRILYPYSFDPPSSIRLWYTLGHPRKFRQSLFMIIAILPNAGRTANEKIATIAIRTPFSFPLCPDPHTKKMRTYIPLQYWGLVTFLLTIVLSSDGHTMSMYGDEFVPDLCFLASYACHFELPGCIKWFSAYMGRQWHRLNSIIKLF